MYISYYVSHTHFIFHIHKVSFTLYLLLYCYLTATLLLLYWYVTATLLLLYCSFTTLLLLLVLHDNIPLAKLRSDITATSFSIKYYTCISLSYYNTYKTYISSRILHMHFFFFTYHVHLNTTYYISLS